METDMQKGRGVRNLIRRLCFMAIGAGAMANPLDPLNIYNLGVGLILGLLFGFVFRLFLKGFLGLFNGDIKKEKGKKVVQFAVDNGMLFLAPFTIMLLIAVFYLGWSMTLPFVSAGVMAVGTSASIEMNKLLGKPAIKNTVAAAGVSFAFSMVWTLSFFYMNQIPGYVEGGITLLTSLMGGGIL